ncbi:ribosome biogenesis GTPase Der [Pelagibacterales bacterium SAG-MED31]|nr:ribosome biogenesis GTPase Der [Pelagibacterales bacterium SAG-MED31]
MKYLLIGKPNAGKTSIYNKLAVSNNIIHKEEGTTRDWHKSKIRGLKHSEIYDSPGVTIRKNKSKELHFSNVLLNIDTFLYVVDFNNKSINYDKESINELRKLNKKLILIINKDDRFDQSSFFLKTEFENLFYISCAHNLGFEKLYEYLENNDNGYENEFKIYYSIAIFGKPNAGKSTLANSLLGYERILTSKSAGTTSDIVEDIYLYKNKSYNIIDTAGIFRKNKIDINSINFAAIRKSLNLKKDIDLSLILIDCNEGFDTQIKKIFKILINQSKSIIIVFNKLDTIKNKIDYAKKTKIFIKETFSQIKNISTLFISAKNEQDIIKLKNLILKKSQKINKRIPTSKLNSWLKKVSLEYPHPLIKGKAVNFKYAVQTSTSPITIKIFTNYSKNIKKNYQNYLINKIIKSFNISDSKVNLYFSSSKNPFM